MITHRPQGRSNGAPARAQRSGSRGERKKDPEDGEAPLAGILHLQSLFDVAQRVGFEPTVPLLVHLISSCSGYWEDKKLQEILRSPDTPFHSDFESDELPKQRVEKM